jgi:hypothetical protein
MLVVGYFQSETTRNGGILGDMPKHTSKRPSDRINQTAGKETVSNWSNFAPILDSFKGRWHFRGVLDGWPFETSLERVTRAWNVKFQDLSELEKLLLSKFKRAYPVNANVPPPDADDILGWLALMQHHGAPTRLLDWTYSPFVAAFFALDKLLHCNDKTCQAAVWALSIEPFKVPEDALSTKALKAAYRTYQKTRGGGPFRKMFFNAKRPVTSAFLVNPYRRTEREVFQQGVFLMPGNICRPFEENLLALPGVLNPRNLKKIILPRSVLPQAFRSLHRMNINSATLFPGVDGYARGLHHGIEFLLSKDHFHGTA